MLEPGALVCELYHLIFDAIFLFIPQFYIMMKIFLFLQNPYLFYRFPRSSVCLSQFWSDVKLVGFCLCNVSMVRLYFVFSEYYGVSVHDESPSFEIEVH